MKARIRIIVVLYKFFHEKDDPYCHFGVIRIWRSSNLVSVFNEKFLAHLQKESSSSTLSNFYVFSMEIRHPSESLGDFNKMPQIRRVLDRMKISKSTSEQTLVDILRVELENAGGKDVNLIRVWKKN